MILLFNNYVGMSKLLKFFLFPPSSCKMGINATVLERLLLGLTELIHQNYLIWGLVYG